MKRWEPIAYPGPDNDFGAATHRNFNQSTGERGSWPDGAGYQNIIDELCALAEAGGETLDGNLAIQILRSVRSGKPNYRVAGGTANALTVTLDPPITAYSAGLILRVLTGGAANTGAMTINVDTVGVVPLQNNDGTAIAAGAVGATSMIEIICDGTNWRLLRMRAATTAEVEAAARNDVAVTPLSLVSRRSPFFVVTGSSGVSIPNGVDTKITNLTSVTASFFNTGSSFSSSAFTCGATDAGAWLFIGYAALEMLVASAGGTTYRLAIAKNASTGPFQSTPIGPAGTYGNSKAQVMRVAAGDVIDLRAYQDTGTNRNVFATELAGIRLGA